jgi:hypothetical protein
MTTNPGSKKDAETRWQIVARGRLYFELAGLAFAVKSGHSPEDFARHIWGQGAARWMGKPDPTAQEYISKEVEAHEDFIPGIQIRRDVMTDREAQVSLLNCCWNGYGEKRWGTAAYWGLELEQVCRFCHETYRVWGQQLGLTVTTRQQADGSCILRATRP